ncbi:MAG: TonB family protein [Candidatus Eremiobacteraeota bacterium]|nr:TonB family protein [Candidatus Eremiobacteraeota bacterium]
MLTLLVAAVVVLPYYVYHHRQASEPIGARVFDQVVSTIALRYFDRSYHGVAWRRVAQQHRHAIVDAPTTAARYAALRALIATLRDSHTAVYSPDELQPPRERSRRAVLGMSPDYVASGPAIDWHRMKGGIGYLRIASFPDSLTGVLAWALSDIGRDPAMILDLRGNPGGLVDSVDEVAGVFLPPGTLISSGTRRYHLFGPQQFTANDAAGATYQGRLVVLIDRDSRSGAESLARALQYYHRATLVGTRTAGKVLGVDAEIPLDDGGLLRVATLDMRDPSGQRLEGRGVSPDVAVDPQHQLAGAVAVADAPAPAPQPTTQWICPISVSSFWLDGEDPTHGYARFGVLFSNTGKGAYGLTLRVDGTAPGEPSTVRLPRVDPQTPAFTFVWPSHYPVGVTISRVEDLRNGSVLACTPEKSDNQVVVKPAGDAVTSFDDGAIAFSDEVVAKPLAGFQLVTDSDFVYKAPLRYPVQAIDQGIQGTVVVQVTVGAGGKLLDAQVWRSSGSSLLNAAALEAARASIYTEPSVNGTPQPSRYLIDYVFLLR